MSDEHKAALAGGREQGRAVRRYLEAVESTKPRRGRKRTPESIQKRLAAIEEQLGSADPLNRVHLVQERIDLEQELAARTNGVDLQGLEAEFVAAAAAYGQRKGISSATTPGAPPASSPECYVPRASAGGSRRGGILLVPGRP